MDRHLCWYLKTNWNKTKAIINHTLEELSVRGCPDHKKLERDKGFIYLTRTYMNMCPSVKGIHQTQDSWCGGSDKNGLKLCGGDLISLLNSSLKEIL